MASCALEDGWPVGVGLRFKGHEPYLTVIGVNYVNLLVGEICGRGK